MGKRLLLAGRLGVEVDDDGVGARLQRAGGELAVDGAEGAVELGHEDAAHGVDDEHVGAVPGLEEAGALPRRAGREIDRPQETGLALDEDEGLLLIEGVVAERHHVGAGVEEVAEDGFGDAEAPGRVLAIDDDEVELIALDEARDGLDHRIAARAADHIAEE